MFSLSATAFLTDWQVIGTGSARLFHRVRKQGLGVRSFLALYDAEKP
jgi:hypothetical protein